MKIWAAVLIAAVVPAAITSAPLPVVLAGRVVFRIADPGPYGTLQARLQAIDQQITQAISCEDVGNPRMVVVERKGLWSIFIGNTFLTSVYAGDATLYGKPPRAVAEKWASELKKAFPLAEPVCRLGKESKAALLDRPGGASQAAPLKVPTEHWGIVNLYMMLLWKARQVEEDTWAEEEARLAAEIIENAARHYLAPACSAQGHEPGTCPGLRTCPDCQAQMAAAIAVEENERNLAASLASAMAADELATRAVKQVFEYVRHIDQKRFMTERVRISWQLWRRLAQRAASLCQAPVPQSLPATKDE